MSSHPGAYFDNNATTPLDERVLEAMLPWLRERHGNPSSVHGHGRAARAAVEDARRRVAGLLSAEPREIVFTASGTEANNAVIFGLARRAGHRGHLVVSAFEHPSVLEAVERLEARGMGCTRVPPGEDGVVPAEKLIDALEDDTVLLCLMLANNELGTLQPVEEVATACRERGIPLLSDAVQVAGKAAVDPRALGVDYLTVGGHKFHGPLGAAALWFRPGAPCDPLLAGAPQEGGRRPGTENVPALVGLGAACELAQEELETRRQHLADLRRRLEEGLARVPGARLHCTASPRLPHTTNVAFPGVPAALLVPALDAQGFSVSAGAACGAGKPEPSPTLKALGLSDDEALSSLRISFGMTNTVPEVAAFLDCLPGVLGAIRRQVSLLAAPAGRRTRP